MSQLSLVCISDTHNKHKQLGELPLADVLIHAGDFSSMGYPHETEEFLKWFNNQPHDYKIFISGNHDFLDYDRRSEFEEILAKYPEVTYLRDSGITIDGIKFWGRPWTPEFFDWAFMLPRGSAQMRKSFEIIPADTDVLITHGPAFGRLDACANGQRVGCDDMLEWIDHHDTPPKLLIFGHIHHSSGMMTVGNTTYINAACLNDYYKFRDNGIKFITYTLETK